MAVVEDVRFRARCAKGRRAMNGYRRARELCRSTRCGRASARTGPLVPLRGVGLASGKLYYATRRRATGGAHAAKLLRVFTSG